MILPALWRWHRRELRFDLRAMLHIGPNELSGLSWNELWDYVSEILRRPSSHTSSAMHGDKYVPDQVERAVWAVFEQWLNTQMPKGTPTKRVPRPWAGKKPRYIDPRTLAVTPEREARRKALDALF